jgi:hypothetical protein
VQGAVPEGHEVALAVTHEAGWQATQDGSLIELRPNGIGFLTAKARPAARSLIRFEYRGTPEQRAMAVLSLVVWGFTLRYLWRRWRATRRYDGEKWQQPSRMSAAV